MQYQRLHTKADEPEAGLPTGLAPSAGRQSSSARRRRLRLVWVASLAGLAVHPTARALADDVATQADVRSLPALATPRDPVAFLASLEVVVPPMGVPLTRQEAVAQELLTSSRTLSPREAATTAAALCAEAAADGYDPLMFLAMIHVESRYDHLAISPVGAEGLMQLMPPTAEWMAKRLRVSWAEQRSFDPVVNVRLGVRYLVYLHRKFRRLDVALTAYNRGPAATRELMARHGGLPKPVSDYYSAKVLAHYARLRATYGHLPLG